MAAAAAAVIHPTVGEAMPVAPQPDVNPKIGESGVATEADLEGAKVEKAYYYYRRRRFRRFYYRPRYRFYRRRFYRPRFYRRRFYRFF